MKATLVTQIVLLCAFVMLVVILIDMRRLQYRLQLIDDHGQKLEEAILQPSDRHALQYSTVRPKTSRDDTFAVAESTERLTGENLGVTLHTGQTKWFDGVSQRPVFAVSHCGMYLDCVMANNSAKTHMSFSPTTRPNSWISTQSTNFREKTQRQPQHFVYFFRIQQPDSVTISATYRAGGSDVRMWIESDQALEDQRISVLESELQDDFTMRETNDFVFDYGSSRDPQPRQLTKIVPLGMGPYSLHVLVRNVSTIQAPAATSMLWLKGTLAGTIVNNVRPIK